MATGSEPRYASMNCKALLADMPSSDGAIQASIAHIWTSPWKVYIQYNDSLHENDTLTHSARLFTICLIARRAVSR